MERSIENDLTFTHLVVATSDGTIFASARNTRGRIQNYLISRFGDVKRQIRARFELVSFNEAQWVKHYLETCYSIPVYKTRFITFN